MSKFALILVAGISTVAFASAAHAADLIIEEPETVGVVDAGGTWDGVFVGGFVGYSWGDFDDVGLGPDYTPEGWFVGVDVGANFTLTNGIVAGIVGDIAYADITSSGPEFHWMGSVRGRLGFDGGSFMPYLTAGLAFANEDTYDITHWGWTVGAGVEVAVTENLSVDLLYRYNDLSEEDYGFATYDYNSHQVSAGLHWKF